MENQIVNTESNMPAVLSESKLQEFLKIAGVAQKLTEEERKQFVEIAQAYGLNPFKREIYCTSYGEGQSRTTSIITGYEVYIKRAERTGKLDGWNVEVSGSGNETKAVITIYRKDWKQPFKHEVFYSECVQISKKTGQPNAIWAKMPRFMVKKVAIAQGFRLCFSDELGGMPYTSDELPQEEKKETVQDAILELPQDAKNALEEAKTKADLKQICRDVVTALGDAYKPALNQYYREHAGTLGD
ncbi:MAG: phage recombination protein Bet [Candidatus Avelusimicrobium sp.]|uniref:phage recombination protein Bet n=1 Tax=Candidatus Avelusimicrobium sp. TaxID=3048833 RepID=UPI003EFF5B08